jgi:outer membrane biosynthesis protein TonB
VFVPRPPQPPKVEKAEPRKPEPPRAEPAKLAQRPASSTAKEAAPKAPADSFASLLKSVEKLEKRVEAPEQRAGTGTAAADGARGGRDDGAAAAANAAELAAMISRQVTPCWRIPIGAQDAGRMRAELNIVIGPDGNVRSVVPLDEGRLNGDPVFRAFAESAVRAVRACSPLKLPAESYDVWRNVIFNFDPSQMTG